MSAGRGQQHMTNLQVVIQLGALSDVQRWCAVGGMREMRGRRGLERLGAAQALVHAREIDIPRLVHGLRVLLPEPVHLVCVVSICAVRKGVVGRGCLRGERPEQAGSPSLRAHSNAEAANDTPGQHFERRKSLQHRPPSHLPFVTRHVPSAPRRTDPAASRCSEDILSPAAKSEFIFGRPKLS